MHVALLATAVFLALAAHEAGHALGGGLRGLRLTLFVVGPVHVRRGKDGRLRCRLNTNLSYAGGKVACAPSGTARLRPAMLWCAAGGPVASIAVGMAALATCSLSDLKGAMFVFPGSFQSALALGLVTLGAVSCGLGLWALLPRKHGTLASDGAQILGLRRASASADRYAAVMVLGGCMMAGVRPRDWEPDIVAQAISVADGSSEDLAARHMAYEHALDRGDIQAAREHMSYMLDHLGSAPIDFRPIINVEAAYFEAAYDDAPASARRRLGGAWKRAVHARDATAVQCAEGAVLLAEGNVEEGYARLRDVYATLTDSRDLSAEPVMLEIRRLCRARGLPDPGDDSAAA